jgi:hypothetical protein
MNKVMNLRVPWRSGNILVKQPHAATVYARSVKINRLL